MPEKTIKTKQPSSSIYVIQCMDYYKIGYSKHPKQRMSDMQVGNPFTLKIVYEQKVKNFKLAESVTHQNLSHKQIRGEWFNCELQEIISVIRLVCSKSTTDLRGDQVDMIKKGIEPIKIDERNRLKKKVLKERKRFQLAQMMVNSDRSYVELDKHVITTMLSSGVGLCSETARILGLTYPLSKGWKQTLHGKKIPKADYIRCIDKYIRPDIKRKLMKDV